MKTRQDILEEMHDAGLSSLIDAELVLKIMTRRQIVAVPSDDQTKIDAIIVEQKRKVNQLDNNIKVVEEMIREEIIKINTAVSLEEKAKQ